MNDTKFKKGYIPWNKGKTGVKTNNKGITFTPEHKKKLSDSKLRLYKEKGNVIGFKKGNKLFWKGGTKTDNGYIYKRCEGHPKATRHGQYVLEHRLVMERKLGRFLESWEWVHHKNGIKNDNRIENLEIVFSKKHFGLIRCPHCLHNFFIK